MHVYFFQAPTIFTNITSVCVNLMTLFYLDRKLLRRWFPDPGFEQLMSNIRQDRMLGASESLVPRSLRLGEWGLQAWGLTWMEPALVSDVILSDSIVSE